MEDRSLRKLYQRIIEACKNPKKWQRVMLKVSIALGVGILAIGQYQKYKTSKTQARWAEIVAKKRYNRNNYLKNLEIPSTCLSSEEKASILQANAQQLAKFIRSQRFTSEQVLITYFEVAVTKGLELGLITEVNFEGALAQAREYDRLLKQNGAVFPEKLLLGVPISIKDTYELKGFDSTAGLASRCNKPFPEDGFIIKILKDHGAIPFIKTNTPQTLAHYYSDNWIWGLARNPKNASRIAGGSSGGEGGLVAMNGSPLGLGTDAAGSIRIPALFCGIYGFKPTSGRVTPLGHSVFPDVYKPEKTINVGYGPIAKSVHDVELMMECLTNPLENPIVSGDRDRLFVKWDRTAAALDTKQKFRIGFASSLGFLPESPANQRVTLECAELLEKQGHTLIRLDLSSIMERLANIGWVSFNAPGAREVVSESFRGEKPVKAQEYQIKSGSVSPLKLSALKFFAKLIGNKEKARQYSLMLGLSVSEFAKEMNNTKLLKDEFFKIWAEHKLDFLLVPGGPVCALKADRGDEYLSLLNYFNPFNVLNLPVGVLPTGMVGAEEQFHSREIDSKRRETQEYLNAQMKDSEGMPVGVQVATLPFEDEKCVGFMKLLDNLLFEAKATRT